MQRSRPLAGSALAAYAAGVVLTAAPILAGAAASASPEASGARSLAGVVLTIGWAGDITPGSRYGMPPQRARPLFAAVRDELRAPDLMIGNLEGTLSVGGTSKCGGGDGGNCFSFRAPPRNADGLRWAGFDAMNLANNHSFDFGASGQRQTIAALERRGIAWTGTAGRVAHVTRRGVRVALLGFAPHTGVADLRDIPAARRAIAGAARRADVVVVLMHAGAEGSGETRTPRGREHAFGSDRGDTRGFAHAAIDSGADLVLGSGPHVLRGIERYRGRLIAYSLGNFAGFHNFATGGVLSLSGLLSVEVSGAGMVHGGRFLPLRLDGANIPRPDPSRASIGLVNRVSRADFGARGVRLAGDGRF